MTELNNLFDGITAYILPNGIGKGRIELFRSNLVKYGACLIDDKTEAFDDLNKLYIIFDEGIFEAWTSLEKSLKSKKKIYPIIKKLLEDASIKFIKTSWLSQCLKTKSLYETTQFELKPDTEDINSLKRLSDPPASGQEDIKKARVSSDVNLKHEARLAVEYRSFESSLDSFGNSGSDSDDGTKTRIDPKSWTCAHSSTDQRVNLNQNLIEKLEQMAKVYEATKDKFKVNAYQKAIIGLKQCKSAITSIEV